MRCELGRVTHNGHELIGQTPITFDTPGNHALPRWGGKFTVPEGALIDMPANCQLCMADGRLGDIVVYRKDSGEHRTTVVRFRGIGAMHGS